MSKSGSFKWCVLFVACLALFVYHKSNSHPPESNSSAHPVEPTSVDVTRMDTQLYSTSVAPAQQPRMDEWLADQPDETLSPSAAHDDFDSESEVFDEIDIPFQAPQSSSDDKEIEEEFFKFDSVQSSTPSDAEIIANNLPQRDSSTGNSSDALPRKTILLPDGVQLKAVQHIEYGKSLARRGAVFGAQNEFNSALRLVAQAMDHQFETRAYTDRMHDALTALNEADDFYFAQGENNGRVNVAEIAKRHKSQILSREMVESASAVEAMQVYYNYVQDQLSACSGGTVVAGEALYCLGKLFVLRSKNVVEGTPLDNAKAIVFHRAALKADGNNFKSANELAVLLAKTGRYDQAKNLLIRSLKLKQIPRAWENLAAIHQALGEKRLAELAMAEYQRMLNSPPSTNQIKWVSAEQFAAGANEPAALRTAKATLAPQTDRKTENTKRSSIKKVFNRLF